MVSRAIGPRFGLRLAALAIGTLVALVGVEFGFRAWLRARGEAYDRAATEAALLRAVDTTAAFVPDVPEDEADSTDVAAATGGGLLHPFYGSENQHDTGGVLGYFRNGRDRGAYTVLVVGGSVAAAWSNEGTQELVRRLQADPRVGGKPVRICRAAHGAYKQPQQLARVAFLLTHGYHPDAVINLDGFNEVALGLQNSLHGASPLYPAPNLWEARLRGRRDVQVDELDALLELRDLKASAAHLARTSIERGLTASSVLGTLARRRMNGLVQRRSEGEAAYLRLCLRNTTSEAVLRQRLGPTPPETIEAALELSLQSWFQSSLSLAAICAAHDIDYLHCLQPALYDAGSKPLTDKEAAIPPGAPGWESGVVLGYPRLRELGAQLVERGVRFVDVSQAFAEVEANLYFDPCHFVPAGNTVLGSAIAGAFLAVFPSQPPASDRDAEDE